MPTSVPRLMVAIKNRPIAIAAKKRKIAVVEIHHRMQGTPSGRRAARDGTDDRLERAEEIFRVITILRWATPSRAIRVDNGELELVFGGVEGR